MVTIATRQTQLYPLTHAQVDANFTNLKSAVESAQGSLDTLVGTDGAAHIDNGGESVAASLNALQLADYAALRAYGGPRKSVYVTGYLVTAAPNGIAGMFVRDDSDTTSADNGGTVIVSLSGVRWKRRKDGRTLVDWFGAVGDGVTESAPGIQAAINDAGISSAVHYTPGATYKVSSTIQLALQQAHIGNNATISVASGVTAFNRSGASGFPGRISINGLHFVGTGMTGSAISIANNTPFVSISYCYISGFNEGVRLTDSYSSRISENYIVGNNYGVMLIGECHLTTLANNLLDYNTNVCIGINGDNVRGNLSTTPVHNITIIECGLQNSKYGLWAENCYELQAIQIYHEGNSNSDLKLGVADSGAYGRACYNFTIDGWQSSSPCASGTNISIEHAVDGNMQGLAFNSGTSSTAAVLSADGYSDLVNIDYHRVQHSSITSTTPFNVPSYKFKIARNGREILPWNVKAFQIATNNIGSPEFSIWGTLTPVSSRPTAMLEVTGSGNDLSFKVNDVEHHYNGSGVDKFNIDHLNSLINFGYSMQPLSDANLTIGSNTARLKNVVSQNVTLTPPVSVAPANNGEMTFQLTSNTSLTIKVKGSDGVIRSTNLTLV